MCVNCKKFCWHTPEVRHVFKRTRRSEGFLCGLLWHKRICWHNSKTWIITYITLFFMLITLLCGFLNANWVSRNTNRGVRKMSLRKFKNRWWRFIGEFSYWYQIGVSWLTSNKIIRIKIHSKKLQIAPFKMKWAQERLSNLKWTPLPPLSTKIPQLKQWKWNKSSRPVDKLSYPCLITLSRKIQKAKMCCNLLINVYTATLFVQWMRELLGIEHPLIIKYLLKQTIVCQLSFQIKTQQPSAAIVYEKVSWKKLLLWFIRSKKSFTPNFNEDWCYWLFYYCSKKFTTLIIKAVNVAARDLMEK